MATTVAPLCSWLIAACVSRTVFEVSGSEPKVSSPTLGRRAKRGIARSRKLSANCSMSVLCKDHAEVGGSLITRCGSSLQGLGSCFSFEACPEYNNTRGSQFFPDSFFGSKTINPGWRRWKVRATGRVMAVAVQTVKDAPEKKIITKQRRVVVTGMGVVTSLGHDPDTFYSNLLQGKSGISEIKSFDCKDFPTVNDLLFSFSRMLLVD